MRQSYIDIVQEYCGNKVIVFDKCHIIRHLLMAVDKVRRTEAKVLAQAESSLLKGTRYIWLKNPWNLIVKQKITLTELIKMNLSTAKAYLHKELFRRLWKYKRKASAARYLKRWLCLPAAGRVGNPQPDQTP